MSIRRRSFLSSNDPTTRSADGAAPIPRLAIALGGLGLVPFASLAGAVALIDTPARAKLSFALAAYGAVILSFLGGIQWGLALQRSHAPDPRLLILGIVPSITAWAVVLFVPSRFDLLALAVGFFLTFAIDYWLHTNGRTPPWFFRLRAPLTFAVIACLAIAALVPGPA